MEVNIVKYMSQESCTKSDVALFTFIITVDMFFFVFFYTCKLNIYAVDSPDKSSILLEIDYKFYL